MNEIEYIHGFTIKEQERLTRLNALTNPPFLAFLNLKPTDRVLEVGSGLGALAQEVAAIVSQGAFIGVERAQEQIAVARANSPTLCLLQGDAHALPLADSQFDVVYCRYVLEHVHDPLHTLKEMYRLLKPGGRACAQENDCAMLAFDPDCPRFTSLLPRFFTLQESMGGDALVGRRLYRLFKQAGYQHITLSYQAEVHTSEQPGFRVWVDNIIHILAGAQERLLAENLAQREEIERALAELHELLERDDATAHFYWNRACGYR